MQVFKPVYSIVLQEVPGEISLGFMVSGCSLKCSGCSYRNLKDPVELSLTEYAKILKDNQGLATCVLFMGGEWTEDLITFLDMARDMGFKTCLYTGLNLEEVPKDIVERLDYIKVGRWQGIPWTKEGTNQRFLRLCSASHTPSIRP